MTVNRAPHLADILRDVLRRLRILETQQLVTPAALAAVIDTNAADIGVETFGAAASAGAVGKAADAGHVHKMPPAPVVPSPALKVVGPPAFGSAVSVGLATEYARADHSHGLPPAPDGTGGGSGTPKKDKFVVSAPPATSYPLTYLPLTDSVNLSLNGLELVENTDYTVDYTLGLVIVTATLKATTPPDVLTADYETTGVANPPVVLNYATAVSVDAPVAWWRLGDTVGSTTLADATGNSHTLTVHGTPTLGFAGLVRGDTAMKVSTFGDYGDVAPGHGGDPQPWLDGFTACSVEAWVESASLNTTGGVDTYSIFSSDNNGGPADAFIHLKTVDGFPTFVLKIGAVYKTVTSSASVNDNNRHHVVGTYDGANLLIYVDGLLTGTTAATGTTVTGNTRFQIGRWVDATSWAAAGIGVLDEVAIYNTALSATRVSAHYIAA